MYGPPSMRYRSFAPHKLVMPYEYYGTEIPVHQNPSFPRCSSHRSCEENYGMDTRELRRRFGAQVQALREARGLTQEGLAAKISRSVDTVSSIERGVNATKLETSYRLSRALDVSLSKLFEIDDAPMKAIPKRRSSIDNVVRVLADYDDPTIRRITEIVEAILKTTIKKRIR